MEQRTAKQPMVRLFVALELPGDVQQALASWAASAVDGLAGVRVLSAEHLHVTLCFLGWQSQEALDGIAQACRDLSDIRAGVVALHEAIWLPPRRPRILAIRLHDEEGCVAELQSRLSEALTAGGWYEPERRPYLPHVTVARIRRGSFKMPRLPDPSTTSFKPSRITLFQSHLSPAGARYERLASVPVG